MSAPGTEPLQRRWSDFRAQYVCVDCVTMHPHRQPFADDAVVPPRLARNGVNYARIAENSARSTTVTTASFVADRRMERVQKSVPGAMTFASPKSVREFQSEAFKEASVRAVMLNEGLQLIGDNCFKESLVELMRFPTNKVALGWKPLNTKDRLSVRFTAGTETIFENAFERNDVTEVVVPASVREIRREAFSYCVNLRRVVFEQGSLLEKVGDGAFFETRLKEFRAPPQLREIGDYCFACSTILGSVYWSDTLCKVGRLCFWGTMVTSLPQTVEQSGVDYGLSWKTAVELHIPEGVTCVRPGWTSWSSVVRVYMPDSAEVIDDCAFNEAKTLREVIFTENSRLRRIGEYAFNQSGLESFASPPLLEEIGACAFSECEGLKAFKFNEGLRTIGYYAFSHTRVKDIVLPGSLRALYSGAFECCDGLGRVVIRDGLEEIGRDPVGNKGTFQGSSIDELVLPSTLRKVSQTTFRGCDLPSVVYAAPGCSADVFSFGGIYTSRKTLLAAPKGMCVYERFVGRVTLPSGLEEIGSGWFAESGVRSAVIPRSVKIIRERAFQRCRQLENVSFGVGSALAEICECAFEGSGLQQFRAPGALRQIGGGAFRKCEQLVGVRLNNGLGQLGAQAFQGCSQLASVQLSSQLAVIPEECFQGTALAKVKLPRSVRVIERRAFAGCENLTRATLQLGSSLERVEADAFDRITLCPAKK